MNAIMNKSEGKRLLAVAAVLALAVCCFAVAMPAEDVDAAPVNIDVPSQNVTTVYDAAGLQAALADEDDTNAILISSVKEGTSDKNDNITINNLTIPESKIVYIGETAKANGVKQTDGTFDPSEETTFTVTVTNLTVDGELYNILGKNKATTGLIVNGTMTVNGKLYSSAALGGTQTSVTGFFTNAGGGSEEAPTNYKHMYSGDITDIKDHAGSVKYNNEYVSPEGAKATAIFTYGDVAIDTTTALDLGETKLVIGGVSGAKASVTITGNNGFTGTVMNAIDGDSAKISGLKATTGKNVVLGQGSITISGSIDAGATVEVLADGTVSVSGEAAGLTIKGTADGTVEIGDLKITSGTLAINAGANALVKEGSTVDVAQGATFSNAGNLTLNGTVNGAINNTGKTVIGQNGTATSITGAGTVSSSTAEGGDNTGFKGQLNFNLEISTSEYLSDKYVISEGYTMTIKAGGSLALEGNQLIVNGTLVIENGGSITDVGAGGIVLTAKGTIQNSGIIGKGGFAVDVMAYQDGTANGTVAGSVSLQNVTGISFALDKTVIPAKGETPASVQYQLAFSGNAIRNGTGTNAIIADGALVNDDLTIGNGVKFDATAGVAVTDKAVITVNGDITGAVTLTSGTSVVLNGTTSGTGVDIVAASGKYVTSDTADVLTGTTKVTVSNVRGVTVEVISETAMDADLKKSVTEQRILISGTAAVCGTDVNNKANTEGSISVAQETVATAYADMTPYYGVYVDGELYIPAADNNTVTLKATSPAIVTVNGQISSAAPIIDTSKIPTGSIVGTAYSVGTTDEIYYVTGFDAAYAVIDTANTKTIAVYGDLTLSAEYTLAQGQIIDLTNAGDVKIDENGDVTVENGGYINGTVDTVDGVLTVIYGGVATEPTNYAVKTTNANNDVIYSGLAYALNNATEGQTVNLVKKADVEGSLTIPAGVTLDVNSGATLTVGKNLTVNGTLANHGNVSVGRNVAVTGIIDNTESQTFDVCTDTTDDYDVTVSGTGAILFASEPEDMSAYNGAVYQDNEEVQYVYTTLSNAVALTADYDIVPDIEVIGTYSENATVNAVGNITITGTVNVTEIVLDDCVLTINGTFTGAVTGQSGEDGSTVASTVQFSKATGVVVTNGSAPNDANVTVWTTTVSLPEAIESFGQNGTAPAEVTYETMTVTAGVVTLGAMDIDAGANDAPSVTVNTGATIVIPDTIETGDIESSGLVVDGTITVEGELTAKTGTVINGTMDIALEGKVVSDGMVVTGTVNVATQEDQTPGELTVNTKLVLGERPETLGATGSVIGPVTFAGENPYIVAYGGTDMSGAVFKENEGVSTAYYINDTLYMTVYAQSSTGVVIDTLAEVGEIDLVGYVVPTKTENNKVVNDITWYDADGKEIISENVGAIEAVYTTFKVSDIGGIISVGNGLTMYIDGLTITNFAKEVNDFNYALSVGTHTVSIAANSGYDATNATITFNGQTVQNGGTITVTADMATDGFTLAASGAVAMSSGGSTTVVSGDDGMGLTDYLLIILVVLIVIMAIMVAMRLMRS